MVEFVVALPLLMLLFVGVADYARIHSRASVVATAARAGAQYGAQNLTTSGDTANINQSARNEAVEVGTISVQPSRVCRCSNGAIVNCISGTCAGYGAPRVYVVVTTSASIATLIDYPGLPRSIPVSRTASLRVQ
jgi:Flp pilus assembly protein TadG